MRILLRSLCLLLALVCLLPLLHPAHADYTYTVRLYAGEQGTLRGQDVLVWEGLHYGERVTFDPADVELPEGSIYYVRGFRESGRDNGEVGAPSFVVTGDRDFVVAYGVKGEQTAYSVNFLSPDGQRLAPSRSFTGNVGDKPVVAYEDVDGYVPRCCNQTKTLVYDAAENEFYFYYEPVSADAEAPEELVDLDPLPAEAGAAPYWTAVACAAVGLAALVFCLLSLRKRKSDE